MNTDNFHVGDWVVFKVDEGDITPDSHKIKWCVVRIEDGTVVISQRGEEKEVPPALLLTAQEVKNIENELQKEMEA